METQNKDIKDPSLNSFEEYVQYTSTPDEPYIPYIATPNSEVPPSKPIQSSCANVTKQKKSLKKKLSKPKQGKQTKGETTEGGEGDYIPLAWYYRTNGTVRGPYTTDDMRYYWEEGYFGVDLEVSNTVEGLDVPHEIYFKTIRSHFEEGHPLFLDYVPTDYIQSVQETVAGENPKEWYYKDDEGKTQGPFSTEDMRWWWATNALPFELEVSSDTNPNNFKSMPTLFLQGDSAFLDHLPPNIIVDTSHKKDTKELNKTQQLEGSVDTKDPKSTQPDERVEGEPVGEDANWYYKDNQDKIQGPFQSADLELWWTEGYLPADTSFAKKNSNEKSSIPLKGNFKTLKTYFLEGNTAFLDHIPPGVIDST